MTSDILNEFIEVKLKRPDDFLKVCETLTRMGVTSRDGTKLYQSVILLHKKSHYFLAHFKEMISLDGYDVDISEEDIERRNRIAGLLEQWGLLTIVRPEQIENQIALSKLKIVSYANKKEFQLISKYQIGKKKY